MSDSHACFKSNRLSLFEGWGRPTGVNKQDHSGCSFKTRLKLLPQYNNLSFISKYLQHAADFISK